MRHENLASYIGKNYQALARGPTAVILADDPVELDSTLRHLLKIGFHNVVLLADPQIPTPPALEDAVQRVDYDSFQPQALQNAVNQLIEPASGAWLYYGYNAEYLFYPFCESRNVHDLLAFHTQERRDAFLSYVVDLYAKDLTAHPNAVSTEEAMLDKSGYYALARPNPDNHNYPRERQLDFFGGLRWRFEEHIPEQRRKIDRIALFRAKAGLHLRENYTLSDEEFNTYACPWHNNITTAIASFRTAKALKSNPGSRYDIQDFTWHNSTKFQWHSQQLMDLGLMEPGQWF
ncbi:hypothetical protein EOK75_09935 [Pseudorhodobacter turbinis]|uniref:Uncharacterized protein n=1 Tax=Pseudorhodobacter turbinis TaxID=2500533 RepID=A0A4V1E0W3_9RHOB|nr:hypothetical protein [Pseudorhodobacter turbinis]QCO56034.1 hypothetical protein EOK75_09935 [Pseudorhodobacter turbinis]